MLVLPFVAGATLGGWRLAHLWLGLLWLVAYLAFHAAGRWLRSRRRSRERGPLLVSAAACLPLAAATLATSPQLLRWLPAYLPLLLLSLWLTARGAERSLANDAVTVLAAVLMTPVAAEVGGTGEPAVVLVVTAVLLAYFLGTVLYVKTMIRERGRTGYVVASVASHLLGTAAAAWLVATDRQRWPMVVVWLLLTVRAAAGPALNARRERPLRPVVVGVGEIVASLAVTVLAVLGSATAADTQQGRDVGGAGEPEALAVGHAEPEQRGVLLEGLDALGDQADPHPLGVGAHGRDHGLLVPSPVDAGDQPPVELEQLGAQLEDGVEPGQPGTHVVDRQPRPVVTEPVHRTVDRGRVGQRRVLADLEHHPAGVDLGEQLGEAWVGQRPG